TTACTCLLMSPSPARTIAAREEVYRVSRRSKIRVLSAAKSDVDDAAIGRQDALVHHLGERRVREDAVDQVFLGRLQVHGDDETRDQLGALGADHVAAKELPGLLVEDGLDQAFGLAERDRLAVADERELADADVVARLFCFLLGETNRGNLRAAIGA